MPEETNPAPSVRAFVFGLADGAGALDTAALYDAADAMGYTSTQLRLGLRRLRDADLLEIDGRGRQAQLALTSAGLADRSPDLAWTAAAYRADAGLDPWDGVWHLAAFEIPERRRAARDALRGRIVELYGGQLSGGLYVSPLGWEPWLDAVALEWNVAERLTTVETTTIRHAGTSDPVRVAASVWPVDEVDRGYRSFVERWTDVAAAPPDDPIDAIAAGFSAAAEFESAFRRDPLLPARLVRDDFAGPAARRLFVELVESFSRHDVIAEANFFGTYRRTIDDALAMSSNQFWHGVFDVTSTR